MSENDQQNGTANGDVPEIELIIKVGLEFKTKNKIRNSNSFSATHLSCTVNISCMHLDLAENFSFRTKISRIEYIIQYGYGVLIFHICLCLFVRTDNVKVYNV